MEKMIGFYLIGLSFENYSEIFHILSRKLPPVFLLQLCILMGIFCSQSLPVFVRGSSTSVITCCLKTMKRLLLPSLVSPSSFLPTKAESEAIKKQPSCKQRELNPLTAFPCRLKVSRSLTPHTNFGCLFWHEHTLLQNSPSCALMKLCPLVAFNAKSL